MPIVCYHIPTSVAGRSGSLCVPNRPSARMPRFLPFRHKSVFKRLPREYVLVTDGPRLTEAGMWLPDLRLGNTSLNLFLARRLSTSPCVAEQRGARGNIRTVRVDYHIPTHRATPEIEASAEKQCGVSEPTRMVSATVSWNVVTDFTRSVSGFVTDHRPNAVGLLHMRYLQNDVPLGWHPKTR
jgi:hypothetical protein